MNIDRRLLLATPLAVLALAGCTPNDVTMGGAVKHNIALQVVDPEPNHEGDLTADGSVTAAAQDRYRKGTVKKPTKVNTTTGGSSGGSGGRSN